MTTTIDFLSNTFDGMVAEFYAPPLLAPVASSIIQGGEATFNQTFFRFAVRVRDGNNTILRTGEKTQDIGEVDANGNFSANFLTIRLTDPTYTNIPLADLANNFSLPFVDGSLSITTLTLTTVAGNVRAAGRGAFDTGIVGSIPFNYTYDFDLDPVTSALSPRIIRIDSIATSVMGAQGGLLGWVVNLIVNFITFIFNPVIENHIETTVQEQVDRAVDDAFEGAPEGSMATLRSISATGNQIVVDPFVAIPLANLNCASLITSGSVKVRPAEQVRRLRLMRDKVLSEWPQGRAYIELFRRHSPELIRLLARRPKLLKRVDALIERGLKDFSDKQPEKGILSPETAQLAISVMQALAKEGSPALRRSIELAILDVEAFVGRPIHDVFTANAKRLRKLSG